LATFPQGDALGWTNGWAFGPYKTESFYSFGGREPGAGIMRRDTWIVDPSRWGNSLILAGIEEIRRYNPQRFEMEQLTAVVYENPAAHECVGYKDIAPDEFWTRGYIPLAPVAPPMLMCESAAQLASYYVLKNGFFPNPGVFLAMKGVKFRGMARPGDRIYIAVRILKIRSTLLTAQFQCGLEDSILCSGVLQGARIEPK
jgi:3-hydroxyacyl-[acyl-carrier-protein] dehydratase